MIQGIWIDEAHLFHPDQWVNVYEVNPSGTAYYCSCQVKDLDEDEFEGEDYGLEPTDDDGNVITVRQALENAKEKHWHDGNYPCSDRSGGCFLII